MLHQAYPNPEADPARLLATQKAQQQVEQNTHLKPAHYLALAVACLVFGVWASYITWRFFVYGSASMESDEAVREISIAAATMFIACEMAAFGLAAMLPKKRLFALRWQLLAFAGFMLAFECATIILTQRGITKAADYHAQAVDTQTQLLTQSIQAHRAGAAALRDSVAKEAGSKFSSARERGTAAVRQSLEEGKQIDAKATELAKVMGERKPTTTELLGEDGALYYAVARGLLVSVAGLVFFGAAGALFRAARGAAAQAKGASNPGALNATTATTAANDSRHDDEDEAAPPVKRPNYRQGGDGLPTVAPGALSAGNERRPLFGGRNNAWAVGAAALPVAAFTAAAVAPTPAQAAPQAKATQDAKPASTTEAKPATTEAKAKAKKASQRRTFPAGVKVDTGTGERDGARFRRVRDAVKAGRLSPSVRAIQAAEGGGYKTVSGYLEAMGAEGLIAHDGRRWRLNQPGAQATKAATKGATKATPATDTQQTLDLREAA